MRLIRTALSVVLVVCPSILFAQSFTGTITGTLKDVSGASIPGANITITNQQTSRQDTVVDGRRGPLHVAAPAARRVSRRRGPAGLPPRGAHRHRPDQLDGRHRLHAGSRRAHRRGRSPGRRHAARDEQRHGRQARRQPPHPRAAAEHPQRLFADLPDAGRRRHDRQQLQLDELHASTARGRR